VSPVPITAACGVRQQLIGLLHREESQLIGGRTIGVEALGQATMGSLDLGQRRATQDAQDVVRVGGRLETRHAWS
jgi:hypothetical protein